MKRVQSAAFRCSISQSRLPTGEGGLNRSSRGWQLMWLTETSGRGLCKLAGSGIFAANMWSRSGDLLDSLVPPPHPPTTTTYGDVSGTRRLAAIISSSTNTKGNSVTLRAGRKRLWNMNEWMFHSAKFPQKRKDFSQRAFATQHAGDSTAK